MTKLATQAAYIDILPYVVLQDNNAHAAVRMVLKAYVPATTTICLPCTHSRIERPTLIR